MPSPHQTYQIHDSPTSTISITLSAPHLKAEGLHLQTWGSSYILANLLHKLPLSHIFKPQPSAHSSAQSPPHPREILELGAGTGLVGLSASAIFRAHVLLTDLPPILPGIVANIALNAPLLVARGGIATAGTLDWKSPSAVTPYATDNALSDPLSPVEVATALTLATSSEPPKPTLILAADTMYTPEHPALLSSTIFGWLRKDARARVVVCYPMRTAYLDAMREFWERMEAGGLLVLAEGRETLDNEAGRDGEGGGWDDERIHEWGVWGWGPAALEGEVEREGEWKTKGEGAKGGI